MFSPYFAIYRIICQNCTTLVLCVRVDEGLMCGREELFALALPGHNQREHAGKGLRTPLRPAAEGGLACDDRAAQGLLGTVVGRIDRWVDQPDEQVVEIFLDTLRQLLAFPIAPATGRKPPQLGAHLVVDPFPPGRV